MMSTKPRPQSTPPHPSHHLKMDHPSLHRCLTARKGNGIKINEHAILLIFHGTSPKGMCEVFLGMLLMGRRSQHSWNLYY